MSYQIITRITITPDLRVMVRMAANNIRPLDFRYDEVVSLTETLRTKGRPTLELELLSLFFKGLWQGRTRYDRAVSYALLTDGIRGVGTLPRGQGVRTWPAAAHAGLPALSARSVPLPPRISKKPCAAYLCRIHLFFAAEAPHLSERPRRAGRAVRKGLESRQVPNRRRRNEP